MIKKIISKLKTEALKTTNKICIDSSAVYKLVKYIMPKSTAAGTRAVMIFMAKPYWTSFPWLTPYLRDDEE